MSTTENREAIRTLKGSTCVYQEKCLLCVVLVTDVQVDDRGVAFELQPVPTPGFDPLGYATEPMDPSAAWGVLIQTQFSLSAHYVSWFIAIDPEIVWQIIAFAITAPSEDDVMGEMSRLVFAAELKARAAQDVS